MKNPDRVAFTIFGQEVYWYGILMSLGILIAVLLALREAKRKNLKEDTIIDLALVIIPCGVIGARLYYVLFELERYLANPISILYLWEGGLAIYGAVIGGLLGAYFFARRKKLRFLTLADCVAPGLVLAQAIGRWGNFFNQEAYGPAISDPNWWWFPFAVRIDAPWRQVHYANGEICTNPYHMATFFYESAWCVLVFIFLWSNRKKFKHDGDAILWYAILYGFERMLVESLRVDSLMVSDFAISQILSAVLFVGGVAFLIIRRQKEKKLGRLIWPSMPEVREAAGVAPAAFEGVQASDSEEEKALADEQTKSDEQEQDSSQE